MNKYEEMEKCAEFVDMDEVTNRVVNIVLTREDTRAQADALFGGTSSETRKKDAEHLKRLFLQAPASAKAAPDAQVPDSKAGLPQASRLEVASNMPVEKVGGALTEAQRLFPELLQVRKA